MPILVRNTMYNHGRYVPTLRLLPVSLQDGSRLAVILDRTILYPQGGGQPADFGWISSLDGRIRFRVEDVRSKGSIVHHYGYFEDENESPSAFSPGQEVALKVDADRRLLHCRSRAWAGSEGNRYTPTLLPLSSHLFDSCTSNLHHDMSVYTHG